MYNRLELMKIGYVYVLVHQNKAASFSSSNSSGKKHLRVTTVILFLFAAPKKRLARCFYLSATSFRVSFSDFLAGSNRSLL